MPDVSQSIGLDNEVLAGVLIHTKKNQSTITACSTSDPYSFHQQDGKLLVCKPIFVIG